MKFYVEKSKSIEICFTSLCKLLLLSILLVLLSDSGMIIDEIFYFNPSISSFMLSMSYFSVLLISFSEIIDTFDIEEFSGYERLFIKLTFLS